MRHRLIAAFAMLLAIHGASAQVLQYDAPMVDDAGVSRSAPTFVTPAGALPTFEALAPTAWAFASATGGIVNTTTAVTLKGGAAGIRLVVNSCQIATDALGAATELAIRDGAGGTVLWRGKLQTAALPLTNVVFEGAPIVSSAGNLLEVVTLTAVTGGVYVNCQGYTTP